MEFAAGNAEAKARYAKCNAEYQEAVQQAEFLAERAQQAQQQDAGAKLFLIEQHLRSPA